MKVIGVDPSLSCTGLARANGTVESYRTNETDDRIERMDAITVWILDGVQVDDPDLIIIEGYAYGAQGKAITKLAELGGILRWRLWHAGRPWMEIPSTSAKKYATGRGNCNKYAVMVAARERLGYMGLNDNEADALWLRAFGMAMLDDPVCELPKVNREALKGWRLNPKEG